jgi:hypothetical protein
VATDARLSKVGSHYGVDEDLSSPTDPSLGAGVHSSDQARHVSPGPAPGTVAGSTTSGLEETYGPVYSNLPTRDDLPEYSKLISGSVSLRMRERRTAAVPA